MAGNAGGILKGSGGNISGAPDTDEIVTRSPLSIVRTGTSLADYKAGRGYPAQEAHMRRAFSIAAVTSLILWITLASSKAPGDLDAIKGEFHNQLLIEGLHVALPDSMKGFPKELVPLP